MISSSQRPLSDNTKHSQQTDIHAPGGIRTHDLSRRAAVDLDLRPRDHWDRLVGCNTNNISNVYFIKSISTPCRLENNRSWESFEGLKYLHLQGRAVQSNDENFTLKLKPHIAFEKSINICQSIRCEFTEVTIIQHGCANVETLNF